MKKAKVFLIILVIFLVISIPTVLYFKFSGINVNKEKSTSSSNIVYNNEDEVPIANSNRSSSISKNSSTKLDQTTSIDKILNEETASSSITATKLTSLSANDFINSLDCIDYTIKDGDTLSSICTKYSHYCNLGSCLNIISKINNITSPEEIKIGDVIKIPESTLTSGTLYTVKSGDSWYDLRNDFYENYDIETIINFIVDINQLPSDELPLGEDIFLPRLDA